MSTNAVSPRRRPGRFIPEFTAMRQAHDAHRSTWVTTGWSSWRDCDTCIAIAVVDQLQQQIALYDSGLAPLWQRAAFIAFVLVVVAAIAIVGAGLVILPYLARVRP